MSEDALELIITRNQFFKKNYHNLVLVNCALLFIIILLAGFIYYQFIDQSGPKYFPTTPDGRLIEMPDVGFNHLALDQQPVLPDGRLEKMPSISLEDLDGSNDNALVLHWAKKAALAMFDLDFVNYRKAIQDVRGYFSAIGHKEYLDALDFSKNLNTVKFKKAVVFPEINGEAVVVKAGHVNESLGWKVEVPIKVTYENPQMKKPLEQELIATLLIVRVTTLQSPFYGLAIVQANFVVKEY